MSSSPNIPFLFFDRVSFSYNGEKNVVIRDFTARVSKGKKLCIKADSGQGKTTLLRLLLGFQTPDSGKIQFNGEPVGNNNFSKIRTSAAWLPQDLNLGDGTVQEVVNRIFEFRHNQSLKPGTDKMQITMGKLGLSFTILDKPLQELSTGQRQRVGLAICHLLDRPLLLLDEPTSALDLTSRQRAADLLLSDPERTVISTTHDSFWLERCDNIVEL